MVSRQAAEAEVPPQSANIAVELACTGSSSDRSETWRLLLQHLARLGSLSQGRYKHVCLSDWWVARPSGLPAKLSIGGRKTRRERGVHPFPDLRFRDGRPGNASAICVRASPSSSSRREDLCALSWRAWSYGDGDYSGHCSPLWSGWRDCRTFCRASYCSRSRGRPPPWLRAWNAGDRLASTYRLQRQPICAQAQEMTKEKKNGRKCISATTYFALLLTVQNFIPICWIINTVLRLFHIAKQGVSIFFLVQFICDNSYFLRRKSISQNGHCRRV